VGDKTHIRFIDAHAEGDGGYHNQPFLPQEAALVLGPGVRVQTGVVGQGGEPLGVEPGGGFIHLFPGQAVDDARLPFVAGEKGQELAPGIVLFHHRVVNVGPVKTGHKDLGVPQAQAADHFLPGGLVRRGGEGDAGHFRIALVQGGELQVFGTEIVAPLGDAVGLVNGKEGQPSLGLKPVQQIQAAVAEKAFRGHVEQVQVPVEKALFGFPHRFPILGGIEIGRLDPQLGQGIHLILHQGD